MKKVEEKQRPRTSVNSSSLNSGNLFQKGKSSFIIKIILIILTNFTEEFKGDLDVMYLIMKTSPKKYDMNTIHDKMKSLNQYYIGKKKSHNITKTDELYYKYNILYGTNSNEVLRSYSPKMRPLSSFPKNISLDKDQFCFSPEDIASLYEAKCRDLRLKVKERLEKKFFEYCEKKCVNRVADFTECNLGVHSASVLAKLLLCNENIAELILSKNKLGDEGVKVLMSSVSESLNIVHLDLSSNDISPKGGEIILDAVEVSQSLISLNLNSLEGVNRNRIANAAKKFERILNVNKFLEFLGLRGNVLRNEDLKSLIIGLNNNASLLNLDVSNNEITSVGVAFFSTVLLSSKLMNLNISDNQIGNEGIAIIADCMSRPSLNQIRRLNFAYCNITFAGCLNFYMNVHLTKKLEYLNLNGNNLQSDNFGKIKPFLGLQTLKELHMAKCNIGNEGATAVAEGALNWNTLQILDLSDNKINDKGFAAFQLMPESNSSLEHFDISKNFITDWSAKDFVKNLVNNPSLISLNFYDNQLKNEAGTALIEVLRTNKNLTKVTLKFNRIQNLIVEEIERLLKQNAVLYKQKYIPNLKKEIRQNYVTNGDFDQTDAKIMDAGNNIKIVTPF